MVVSWTSCASNDDQTFQAGRNDGRVKASASANVPLASITGATTFHIQGWLANTTISFGWTLGLWEG